MLNNKVLIYVVKAVVWVLVFFILESLFQYVDTGAVDYSESVKYAVTRGLPFFVIFELIDYFRKKKK